MINEIEKKHPQSTIQLDKLVFSCYSKVEDNFDYHISNTPEYLLETEFQFNRTKLIRTQDPSRRYHQSFEVLFDEKKVGNIDFQGYGAINSNLIRFTVWNEVFYTNRLKSIPKVLDDLNLEINNFSKIDIAVDCYGFDFEKVLRINLLKKSNTIKLLGKIVKDREKIIEPIVYFNSGSLNNPLIRRTISIKNKKGNCELQCYNKAEEIKKSGKEYINDYHNVNNPDFEQLYRMEIRLQYDEIRKYIKNQKKPILFADLLNSQFLSNMFSKYVERIIVIYKDAKRREKVSLYPPLEGILQPTLPNLTNDVELANNENNIVVNDNVIIENRNSNIYPFSITIIKERIYNYFKNTYFKIKDKIQQQLFIKKESKLTI